MQIELTGLGKRFNRHWIFRKLSANLLAGQPAAITGPNGSGKSTLLQVIAGAMEKSEGTISWSRNGLPIPAETHFHLLGYCAPYLEVVEELTLTEMLQFHQSFKPWLSGIDIPTILSLMGLELAANKQIRDFSSGMKQRVKLAQAILSNTPVLLLDEPTSNLDANGIAMYHQWMERFANNRLLVIASNDESEIGFCKQRIHISDFQ